VKYNHFVTFSCSTLFCTVFSSSLNAQLELCGQYSRFMAQMTWLSKRTVFGGWTMSDINWGNVPQKPTEKGRKIIGISSQIAHGPIHVKFGVPMQNEMPMTTGRSKSKR